MASGLGSVTVSFCLIVASLSCIHVPHRSGHQVYINYWFLFLERGYSKTDWVSCTTNDQFRNLKQFLCTIQLVDIYKRKSAPFLKTHRLSVFNLSPANFHNHRSAILLWTVSTSIHQSKPVITATSQSVWVLLYSLPAVGSLSFCCVRFWCLSGNRSCF